MLLSQSQGHQVLERESTEKFENFRRLKIWASVGRALGLGAAAAVWEKEYCLQLSCQLSRVIQPSRVKTHNPSTVSLSLKNSWMTPRSALLCVVLLLYCSLSYVALAQSAARQSHKNHQPKDDQHSKMLKKRRKKMFYFTKEQGKNSRVVTRVLIPLIGKTANSEIIEQNSNSTSTLESNY